IMTDQNGRGASPVTGSKRRRSAGSLLIGVRFSRSPGVYAGCVCGLIVKQVSRGQKPANSLRQLYLRPPPGEPLTGAARLHHLARAMRARAPADRQALAALLLEEPD